jgi:16S rRNA processing protein RimM
MPLWKLDNPVHTGTIIKPHSYLGTVKVAFLFYELQEAVEAGQFLYILHNQKPVPYLIESVQWTDEKNALIKLTDINSEEEAESLRGKEIVMPETELGAAEEDETEGEELKGYKVQDDEGQPLGEITNVIEGPQNLLRVVLKGHEYLIPYHEDLIIKVDHENKLVTAILPEGLLDL